MLLCRVFLFSGPTCARTALWCQNSEPTNKELSVAILDVEKHGGPIPEITETLATQTELMMIRINGEPSE